MNNDEFTKDLLRELDNKYNTMLRHFRFDPNDNKFAWEMSYYKGVTTKAETDKIFWVSFQSWTKEIFC